MLRIKRLYTYVLQTFLPLFLMTFGICLFIVLMQFLWRYIDDMVGKGISISILAEMLFYAALSLVPMALPLAILLASLMTFGNLGEQLELLAMKSAGVSLIRIMRPLIITLVFISVGAFFFQNNMMPVAQVKLYSLLYSIRQKSPELEIPEGVFYSEIQGYNVYVKKKERTGLLKDIMIYDYSDNFNNAKIILADSGRLKTSADKMFLVLSLHNGESFQNRDEQTSSMVSRDPVAYMRETFEYREFLIEFDANFERTDESLLQNQYIGKNLEDLQSSIDSMSTTLDSINTINSKSLYDQSYKKTLSRPVDDSGNTQLTESRSAQASSLVLNFDSIFNNQELSTKAALLTRAKSASENTRSEYYFRAATLADEAGKYRRHITEWHKKFTLSFACLVFFFIGAPLGAIIRKGGLGMPVVISVLLFIFYYIIDNIGFKMAREGVWAAWQGMWLSSFVLAPLGMFLTYKAVNDSVILNADTYLNALKNLFGKRSGRKVEKKEVIIFTPDYEALLPRLELLAANCDHYLSTNKRWVNYIQYWKNGGKDADAIRLAGEVEGIVEELENSDQILILNKLMDYPVLGGYNQLPMEIDSKLGYIIAFFIPIGLPVYFLAVYRRKLLRNDIQIVKKTSFEIHNMITGK